jgi:hypothetical protein
VTIRLQISDKNIFLPDGVTPYIPSWYNWNRTTQSGDGALTKSFGASGVRITPNWGGGQSGALGPTDLYDPNTSDFLSVAGLAFLDFQVAEAVNAGLYVCIGLSGGDDVNNLFWSSQTIRNQFIASWQSLTARYMNTDYIACLEILTEPSPHFATPSLNNAAVLAMYAQMIPVIRGVDPTMMIAIGAPQNYNIRWLPSCYSSAFTNVLYFFNFYELTNYVKGIAKGTAVLSYPGYYYDLKGSKGGTSESYPGEGTTVYTDRVFYDSLVKIAADFSTQYNVPIVCDQLGIRSGVSGSYRYTDDVTNIFIKYGIGWAWWAFRGANSQNSLGYDDLSMIYQIADGSYINKDGTQDQYAPPNGPLPETDSAQNWIGLMSQKFAGIPSGNVPETTPTMPLDINPQWVGMNLWTDSDYLESDVATNSIDGSSAIPLNIALQLVIRQDSNSDSPVIFTASAQPDGTTSGVSLSDDYNTSGEFFVTLLRADIASILPAGESVAEYFYEIQMLSAGIYNQPYRVGPVTINLGLGE